MEHEIVVHVWSDIACPWCWIGKKCLEAGIAQSGKKVAVEYHSYQLRPDAPTNSGTSYVTELAHSKSISEAEARELLTDVSQKAASVGLEIRWDDVVEVNTFLAHQFVYAAKAHGHTPEEAAKLGATAVERLYSAHFVESKDIADTDTLLALAEELGLDAERVQNELESGEYADRVRSDIHDAQALGISGVPFFVVGGKFGVSGAQPAEVYADAICRAIDEMNYEHAQEVPFTNEGGN